MNLFFLRLALLGNRGSWARSAGIVAGIAVGVAALLLLLGAFTGLSSRADRAAWVNPSGTNVAELTPAELAAPSSAALVVASSPDNYLGRSITRLYVAVPDAGTLALPGIPSTPEPGDYVASPALQQLIAGVPSDQLGDRYGNPAGTIADSALSSPDQLVVVTGGTLEEVASRPGALVVTSTAGVPNDQTGAYQTVVAVGAVALFFPLVVFIGIVTQLGAAASRERLATLRLIGAPTNGIVRLAVLETLLTTTTGALLGILLALVARPLAAQVSLGGGRFFPADLAVDPLLTIVVAVAVIAASCVAAGRSIRRTGTAPLGSSRQLGERPPKAWRVLPVLLGLAVVLVSSILAVTAGVDGSALSLPIVGGFALVILGIILIGPWITHKAATVIASHAGGIAALVAGRRIASTPRATFRAVSGLVVAIFGVTVFFGLLGAAPSVVPEDKPGLLPADGLAVVLTGATDTDALSLATSTGDGIASAVVAYGEVESAVTDAPTRLIIAGRDAEPLGFTEPPAAAYLSFDPEGYLRGTSADSAKLATADVADATALRPALLLLRTDGEPATIETVRTRIELADISPVAPFSRREAADLGGARELGELAALAYLGIGISIAIAGASLAVATASGMIDRKRVLGLLRLAGMPASRLRTILVYEAAVPLAGVLLVTVGLGFLVVWLMLKTLANIDLAAPEPAYFAVLGAGLLLALLAVAATFPLVRASTGLRSTRFE